MCQNGDTPRLVWSDLFNLLYHKGVCTSFTGKPDSECIHFQLMFSVCKTLLVSYPILHACYLEFVKDLNKVQANWSTQMIPEYQLVDLEVTCKSFIFPSVTANITLHQPVQLDKCSIIMFTSIGFMVCHHSVSGQKTPYIAQGQSL